jgi:hypothetical protein
MTKAVKYHKDQMLNQFDIANQKLVIANHKNDIEDAK